jgi:hypothetical protein
MTISSEVRKAGPFAGNDVTTSFPFAFKVFLTDQIEVVKAVNGVESVLVEGTDYSVNLSANQNTNPGGTVVLTSALETGDTMVVTSRVQNLQHTDLTNQGGFYPRVINDALDDAFDRLGGILRHGTMLSRVVYADVAVKLGLPPAP